MRSRRFVAILHRWPFSQDHLGTAAGRIAAGLEGSAVGSTSQVTRSGEERHHLVPPDRIVRAGLGVLRRALTPFGQPFRWALQVRTRSVSLLPRARPCRAHPKRAGTPINTVGPESKSGGGTVPNDQQRQERGTAADRKKLPRTGGGSFLCLSSDPRQSRIGAVICGNGFVPAALLSRSHA